MLAHASPLTSWAFDPIPFVGLALLTGLYFRRLHTLRSRGVGVPGWKVALFVTGVALLAVALFSPVDVIGEEDLLSVHMAQHILLGDLAPLCMLAGLTGPLLRPVLSLRIVQRLRMLFHPAVALPLWALILAVWHVPVLYGAALDHNSVHIVEHLCFFLGGLVMWAPVLELLPAPEWFGTSMKLGYVVAVRLFETVFANVFFWSGTVFYPHYVGAHRPWGISPLADQGLAGAVMMLEGSVVTLGAIVWLFLRLASEGELRQQLLESGQDPRVVNRAVRYGRGQELGPLR
ncbi:MAG: cytochrome c oxidase assembly protein [Gaiellaceae bacterium]